MFKEVRLNGSETRPLSDLLTDGWANNGGLRWRWKTMVRCKRAYKRKINSADPDDWVYKKW